MRGMTFQCHDEPATPRESHRRDPLKSATLALAELFDHVEDVLVWGQGSPGPIPPGKSRFLINYELDGHERLASGGMEQIIDKTDYDLSPAFLADQFRLDDEHVLAGKRIVNRIEMVGQPDGQTVWNITNKIPLLEATDPSSAQRE